MLLGGYLFVVMNQDVTKASGDVRVTLSRDEALAFYDWLARRYEADEKKMVPASHRLLGEICADLWSQIFGMAPLPDDAYKEQLRQSLERLKSRD